MTRTQHGQYNLACSPHRGGHAIRYIALYDFVLCLGVEELGMLLCTRVGIHSTSIYKRTLAGGQYQYRQA